MQVNVSLLKDNVNKLNAEIGKYENTYLRMYNELNFSHSYANSNKFTKFYNAVNQEKNKVNIFIQDLYELKSIYDYIYSNYSKIGNRIVFNLDNAQRVFSQISAIKSKIASIRRRVYSLSSYPEVRGITNDINYKLNIIENSIRTIENDYRRTVSKINDVERNTSNMIRRFDINIETETDIKPFI